MAETSDSSSKIIGQFYNPALLWGSLAVMIVSIKKLGKDKEKTFLVGAFLVFLDSVDFYFKNRLPLLFITSVAFWDNTFSRCSRVKF